MDSDAEEMLQALGLRGVDDLFADIPASIRTDGLAPPPGLPGAAGGAPPPPANRTMPDMPPFLGAGLYDHFVPAAARAIASRSEFYTAYTPYQAELSQGILQALWEYESMVCELMGMDGANTSMYDGSTALGEAALMARRVHGGGVFLVPRPLRTDKKSVLANYAIGAGLEVREVDYDRSSGTLDLGKLRAALAWDVCGVD